MINSLLEILTDSLKADIYREHYDTGALHNSIQFTFYEGKLEVLAEEYLVYLEDGYYIKSFFEREDIKEIIKEIYSIYVDQKIQEQLDKNK